MAPTGIWLAWDESSANWGKDWARDDTWRGTTLYADRRPRVAVPENGKWSQPRWVPYVAYGGAALIASSRLPLGAHYVSDTFMGAALGYSISRFAVLRQ